MGEAAEEEAQEEEGELELMISGVHRPEKEGTLAKIPELPLMKAQSAEIFQILLHPPKAEKLCHPLIPRGGREFVITLP